ncbi:MAG: hypothetical protein QM754_12000 [Tepidisphaeraceae bacterium]
MADQGPGVRGTLRFATDIAKLAPEWLRFGTIGGELASGFEEDGVRLLAKQMDDNKLTAEASALKLRFGNLFNLKNDSGEFTTTDDAQHYEQTVARLGLPDVTASAFLKYRGAGLDDKNLRERLAVESAVQLGKNRAVATNDYKMANDAAYRDANTFKPRDYQFGSAQFAIDQIYQQTAARKQLFGANDKTASAGDVLWRRFADRVAATRDGGKLDTKKDGQLQTEVAQAFAAWSESARDADLQAYESNKTQLETTLRLGGANKIQARQRLGAINKLEQALGGDGDISAADAAQLLAASQGRTEAYAGVGDAAGSTMQSAVNQFAQVVDGLSKVLMNNTGQVTPPAGNGLTFGPAPALTPPPFMPTPGMMSFGG